MAQQVQLLGGLGVIPTYQFSSDPAVNPYGVNPHVKFPQGWNQMTVQPVGQWPTSGDANLQGLGLLMLDHEQAPAGVFSPQQQIFMAPGLGGVFDSAWWTQRKWLAFGLLGALGIGAAALAVKVLR